MDIGDGIIPVSYTHLDVSKRQVENFRFMPFIDQPVPFRDFDGYFYVMSFFPLDKSDFVCFGFSSVISVSYTHLDVYKRQRLSFYSEHYRK